MSYNGVTRPHYMGDGGTFDERGPLHYTVPTPGPAFNGLGPPVFSRMAGIRAIRGFLYAYSHVRNNGTAPAAPPTSNQAVIGPFGQPVVPGQSNGIGYFGSGGG